MRKFLGLIIKVNIIKSLFYSLKWKGIILIGHKFDLNLKKGCKIIIHKKSKLYLGVGITYSQHGCLDMYESSTLIIHGNVSIHKACKIMIGPNATLSIGTRTYINEHSRIQCREHIEIGERCVISWNVNILDTDEHKIYINNVEQPKTAPIKIGDHVWIGANATILKGCNIKDNVIIGANSLITKDCDSNNIYAGNPGKIIKRNSQWE